MIHLLEFRTFLTSCCRFLQKRAVFFVKRQSIGHRELEDFCFGVLQFTRIRMYADLNASTRTDTFRSFATRTKSSSD